MRMFIGILLLATVMQSAGQSNDSILINFEFIFKGKLLEINDSSFIDTSLNTTSITMAKYYVSNLQFLNKEEEGDISAAEPMLIDASDSASLHRLVALPDGASSIMLFNIGMDSLINVGGALPGDADPIKGMYWAWQSGYVNFKVEGVSSNCPGRKNKFMFHLGGFQAPYNTLQQVQFNIDDKREITVVVDLDKLFLNVDVSKQYLVTSPNAKAVEISSYLPSIFYLKDEN